MSITLLGHKMSRKEVQEVCGIAHLVLLCILHPKSTMLMPYGNTFAAVLEFRALMDFSTRPALAASMRRGPQVGGY